MLRAPLHVKDVVGTVVRLALATIFVVSGALKLADPGQIFLAVRAYDLLPGSAVGLVATALPLLEIALGLALLAGIGTRIAAACAAVLMLAFIGGVAQAWARGLTIDCGCFGGGGPVAAKDTEYPRELAADVGFLVLAVWLLIRPRTRWSVDGWLSRAQPAAETGAAVDEDLLRR